MVFYDSSDDSDYSPGNTAGGGNYGHVVYALITESTDAGSTWTEPR